MQFSGHLAYEEFQSAQPSNYRNEVLTHLIQVSSAAATGLIAFLSSIDLTLYKARAIIHLQITAVDGCNPMIDKLKEYYSTQRHASMMILFVVLNIYMLLEIRNDRFWLSDFTVYHKAAGRLMTGENLYQGDVDGFYRYKYSPTAALYFVPLGFLPLQPARVFYWIFLSAVVCLGLYLASRLARPDVEDEKPARQNNVILISALVMGVSIERELHLGQVNQLLLISYLSFVLFLRAGREILASLILAAGIFLKPFGLVFLPYLLVKRKFRAVIYLMILLVLLGILPAIFLGFRNLAGQFSGWLGELGIELSGKQGLLDPGNHTIFSVLARYTPARFIVSGAVEILIFQALALILTGAAFGIIIFKGKNLPGSMALESAMLMGLIPLLAFTSYNAFGFLEAAVVLILFNLPRMAKPWAAAAVSGLFLVGFNMHDIVGHRLWVLFNDLSLVAVGALILLAVLFHERIVSRA